MPFGAEVLPGRGVRFQLWAPQAARVELCLDGRPPLAMERDPEGWARLVTDRARPGAPYRYRIDGGPLLPDPASRFQPEDVHGRSEVVDPEAFGWTDDGWQGLPWEAMVFYELHVGAFTPEGTFRAAQDRLDYLADLGITAVQLMPVADFPGRWNWGYDGVFPFAPDSRYGRPEDLKALVQGCHARGLALFLDVVYNHFGPEGNYLGQYAPEFFSARYGTPWGKAINFDGPGSDVVRAFFRENALFWIEEYHLDGLRLDAVHAIRDESPVHILEDIARAVHAGPGATRRVHLVLENDNNEARYLRPDASGRRLYVAQWNDASREWTRRLLHLRRAELAPRLAGLERIEARWTRLGESALAVEWALRDGARLQLIANLGPTPLLSRIPWEPLGRCLVASSPSLEEGRALEPWQVAYYLSR